MTQHRCFTSDGMAIVCLCARGVDHDERLFDVPLGEEGYDVVDDDE